MTPKQQQNPHKASPAPPIVRDFATVKLAPGSAHSEYSDFSSSTSVEGADRARVELDREEDRIRRERERSQTPEPDERGHASRQANRSSDSSDEEGGNILDTVVLPVIDSVGFLLLCLCSKPHHSPADPRTNHKPGGA